MGNYSLLGLWYVASLPSWSSGMYLSLWPRICRYSFTALFCISIYPQFTLLVSAATPNEIGPFCYQGTVLEHYPWIGRTHESPLTTWAVDPASRETRRPSSSETSLYVLHLISDTIFVPHSFPNSPAFFTEYIVHILFCPAGSVLPVLLQGVPKSSSTPLPRENI